MEPDKPRGLVPSRRRRIGLLILLILGLGLWFFNVSRAGNHVQGCYRECSDRYLNDQVSLRVLSLNVLHGFPTFAQLQARLDRISFEAEKLEVDILLLQEMPWTPQLGSSAFYLAERLEMNYLYLRANGNRNAILFEEGVAILSRFPILDSRFMELEPQAGFFEHRVVLGGEVSLGSESVWVFSTHLTHGDPGVNAAQVTALQRFVGSLSPVPALVGGDFNASENSPQIAGLSQDWSDTYRVIHPTSSGWTCCLADILDSTSDDLNKRIDYLFLVDPTGQISVAGAEIVLDEPFQASQSEVWISDHLGILLVIEVGS